MQFPPKIFAVNAETTYKIQENADWNLQGVIGQKWTNQYIWTIPAHINWKYWLRPTFANFVRSSPVHTWVRRELKNFLREKHVSKNQVACVVYNIESYQNAASAPSTMTICFFPLFRCTKFLFLNGAFRCNSFLSTESSSGQLSSSLFAGEEVVLKRCTCCINAATARDTKAPFILKSKFHSFSHTLTPGLWSWLVFILFICQESPFLRVPPCLIVSFNKLTAFGPSAFHCRFGDLAQSPNRNAYFSLIIGTKHLFGNA